MSLATRFLTSKTVNNILLGMVRTALATAIPALIAGGWLKADEATGLLGSVCFLAALGLSAFDKLVRQHDVAVALATPVPATPGDTAS